MTELVSKNGLLMALDSDDPMNEDADFSVNTDDLNFEALPRWYIRMAESGEREAIESVARLCAELMKEIGPRESLKIQERYLLDWMQRKMAAIAAGEQPDIALDWKLPGKSGNKPRAYKHMRRATIAMQVINQKEDNPELPLDEIFARVGAAESVSHATVKKCYQDLKNNVFRLDKE